MKMITMIETIATASLAVNENLNIQKRRIANGKSRKRLSLVTGTHGDELEGQYLAYMIGSYLNENIGHLDGIVDIYPALNPMGIDSITRGVPMGRSFKIRHYEHRRGWKNYRV